MRTDVIKLKLKLNLGIFHTCYLINRCKTRKKIEKTRHVKNKDKFGKFVP